MATNPSRDPFGPPYIPVPSAVLLRIEEALLSAGRSEQQLAAFEVGHAQGLLEPYARAAGIATKGKG